MGFQGCYDFKHNELFIEPAFIHYHNHQNRGVSLHILYVSKYQDLEARRRVLSQNDIYIHHTLAGVTTYAPGIVMCNQFIKSRGGYVWVTVLKALNQPDRFTASGSIEQN